MFIHGCSEPCRLPWPLAALCSLLCTLISAGGTGQALPAASHEAVWKRNECFLISVKAFSTLRTSLCGSEEASEVGALRPGNCHQVFHKDSLLPDLQQLARERDLQGTSLPISLSPLLSTSSAPTPTTLLPALIDRTSLLLSFSISHPSSTPQFSASPAAFLEDPSNVPWPVSYNLPFIALCLQTAGSQLP